MLKHEDWPGLEKISALRAFQADGSLRPLSILTGNGGLFLDFEMERGADGAMTGYAFPELLVDVVRLQSAGQRDAAHDLFDAHLPLLRYEQQAKIGLAVRKYVLMRRGLLASDAQRKPGPGLSAKGRAEVDYLLTRLARVDSRAGQLETGAGGVGEGAMRIGVAVMVAALASWGAWAQVNPTTDEIVEALRPQPPSAAPPRDRAATQDGAVSRRSPGTPPLPPSYYDVRPSVSLTVHFATNSTDLSPDAMAALDALGRALQHRALSSDTFRIEGHTDTVGTAEYNKLLSEMRAMRVVDYLSTRFQLDRARLVPVGMGLERLLVPTGMGQADGRNRRVVVVNLTGRWEGI